MMHKFLWVGRKLCTQGTSELSEPTRRSRVGFGQIQRYRVYTSPTDPRIKPVHHLFYRMGPKIVKNYNFCILPDSVQFTGCMEISCVR